jgi:hypothetical protein
LGLRCCIRPPDNFEAALAVSMLVVTCAIVATVFLLSYSH